MDAGGHQRGQRVIVTQRVFLAGDGVIFVDDGDGTQLQQPLKRVLQVAAALLMVEILPCQQHLGHGMIVLAEQPVIGVHQLTLAHSGRRLLGRDVGRLFDLQLADTQPGRRRGYHDQLVTGVLNIAPHLDKILSMADVEQPAGVCQRACAYFNDDTHKSSLSIPAWQTLCRGEHCSPLQSGCRAG